MLKRQLENWDDDDDDGPWSDWAHTSDDLENNRLNFKPSKYDVIFLIFPENSTLKGRLLYRRNN